MERCKICYPGDPLMQCDLRGDHEVQQKTMASETTARRKDEVVKWTGGWEIPLAMPARPMGLWGWSAGVRVQRAAGVL